MSPNNSHWKNYLAIARIDHWVKHIFILPGVVAGFALASLLSVSTMISNAIIGITSACLIASANYVINEWLDAESDRNHPEKSSRPAANGLLRARYVYLEYAVLSGLGLAFAYAVNQIFLVVAFALFVSGVTYNVKPFRTKDKVYVDVLTEAINNPIRLVMGWAIVSSSSIPPLSLLVAYWAGGAFLMAAKRLSEFRFILEKKGAGAPGMYRRSFAAYTVESLTLSCFVYALASSFGLAVFLIKYREEFIFTFPILIVLFAYYLHLGMQSVSIAQKPEHLHRDRTLVLIVAMLVVVACVCAFVDMPYVEHIIQSRFIDFQ